MYIQHYTLNISYTTSFALERTTERKQNAKEEHQQRNCCKGHIATKK